MRMVVRACMKKRIINVQAGFAVSNKVEQHLAEEQGVAKQRGIMLGCMIGRLSNNENASNSDKLPEVSQPIGIGQNPCCQEHVSRRL